MNPNEYYADKDLEDPLVATNEFTDQALVEALLEKHAPTLEKLEKLEHNPRILIIDDGSVSLDTLRLIRELGEVRGLNIVLPEVPVLETVREMEAKSDRRQMALAGTGHASIAKVLAEVLAKLPVIAPEPAVEVFECAPEKIEQVKAPPKAAKHSFKHFQQSRHNKGPSTHRQFAQIRPPRRGGR